MCRPIVFRPCKRPVALVVCRDAPTRCDDAGRPVGQQPARANLQARHLHGRVRAPWARGEGGATLKADGTIRDGAVRSFEPSWGGIEHG